MVINTTRFRKQYLDTQTAVEVTMTFYKPSLTHSPFVKYLFIGANEKGYWNSSYGSPVWRCWWLFSGAIPRYKFVLLFDHNQGHAWKQNGALDEKHMSEHFGGAQLLMQETTLLASEGFLGPIASKNEVGDIHSMLFDRPTDVGPWSLQVWKGNRDNTINQQDKAKELRGPKASSLCACILWRNNSETELQEFARNKVVNLHYKKTKIIHGWEARSA